MNQHIVQSTLTPELKTHIYKQFADHAINTIGFNGLYADPIAFEIHQDQKLMGACVVQLFWGQLHIKYLYVDVSSRKQGLARQLMKHAFAYGKDKKCQFAFVETMSFQAPEFYKKLGFKVEFKREGYKWHKFLLHAERITLFE